jgi:hypothetical protein
VVERANQFLETSFLPGRVFASPEDFNTQLDQWLPKANARLVRRTGARPSDLLGADKATMLALPPVPPVTGFTARVRLPRDYYVRRGSNDYDYSVHPQAIGRFVDITAGLESVTISLDGRSVGTHSRSWGAGLNITDPDHVEAAGRCGRLSKPRNPWASPPDCGTLRIMTGHAVLSSMTGRSPDAGRKGNQRPNRVPLPGDESTTDP